MPALKTGSVYASARGKVAGSWTPADPRTAAPHVRVSVFGPRGGWKDGTEITPAAARALAAELLRAADVAERGVSGRHA